MAGEPKPSVYPELIFGLAGPIGVDMDTISRVLAECLSAVGYKAALIKLTTEMKGYSSIPEPDITSKFDEYWFKMDYANKIREAFGPEALSRIAIDAIRESRAQHNRQQAPLDSVQSSQDEEEALRARPITGLAYIVRQLKHPDEVRLLRRVYGRQFILVSGYSSEDNRRRRLIDYIKSTESTQLKASCISFKATRLIERDASEIGEKAGQQLRDTFHLADVFIDGSDVSRMKEGLERFVNALFGDLRISPNKDEYGMYAAKSASLRSSDLSRQVGAAIFNEDGDVITQGCNEAPKAGGGTYWDSEQPDNRDFRKGFDPNEKQRREVLRDLVERLREGEFLGDKLLRIGNNTQIVDFLIAKADAAANKPEGPLAESWLMDSNEYGRTVHAEMCAICDAARRGRSIKGATLFCTTFPCHNCTKHIIAAGICRVVYMEPYPKSRAKELHEDEVELETDNSDAMVSFVPFLGISPFRYRDIFQRGRRKASNGEALTWQTDPPRPLIELEFPSYTTTGEPWALSPLIGKRVTVNPATTAPGTSSDTGPAPGQTAQRRGRAGRAGRRRNA